MLELPVPSRQFAEERAYDEYKRTLDSLPPEQRDAIIPFVTALMDDQDTRHEVLRKLQTRHDDPVAVEAEWLTDAIAYFDVRSCDSRTADQFAAVLAEVLRDPELAGIILDLRWNHGGRAATATALAGHFVEKGTTIARFTPTVAFAADPLRYDLTTEGEPDAADVPLVILINCWTASTGEVLAAGLQAIGRATVVGSVSFGKPHGSLTLVNGETISPGVYGRPDGTRYDGEGLTPDVASSDEEAIAKAIEVLNAAR